MNPNNDKASNSISAEENIDSRLRQLANAVKDYVFTVDILNDGATRTRHTANCVVITGYSPAEFAADPMLWIRMVLPEDRALVTRQLYQIRSGQDAPSIEHRIRRKDNVVRWVLNTTIPSYNEHGELISYDGVVQDITERNRVAQHRPDSTGQQSAAVRIYGHDSMVGDCDPVPISAPDRRRIADLLQEDLQQLLVAARYQVDRLASNGVHDPNFDRRLESVNDLLGQCACKARTISRNLTDNSQLNLELQENGK